MKTILIKNGNKTITSGSGGAFYSAEQKIVDKVRHLSSTAKCSNKYEHDEIGYNQRNEIVKRLKDRKFYINKIIKDYGKKDRCIISTKI